MKKGDLLLVYGTLRCGEGADLSKRKGATYIGQDRVNGRLYAVGWFPGLKAEAQKFTDSEPAVVGDVFRIEDAALVRSLDSYEGYPTFYDRIQTQTSSGETVWVYTYNPSVHEDSRIHGGDWLGSPNSRYMREQVSAPAAPVAV